MKDKYYLLSFDIQKSEIESLCFGKCGKILFANWKEAEVEPGLMMIFFLCREEACPFLKNQDDEPVASEDDADYYLRALEPTA